MGTIESIQEIICPVSMCLNAQYRISCNIALDTTGILFESFYKAPDTHLLMHIDENRNVSFYFLACSIPPLYRLPWWDIPVARRSIAFFSGPDVFRYLGIPYTYVPKGDLNDLKEIAGLICGHAPQIIDAFSNKNRQKTFDALNDLEAAGPREDA